VGIIKDEGGLFGKRYKGEGLLNEKERGEGVLGKMPPSSSPSRSPLTETGEGHGRAAAPWSPAAWGVGAVTEKGKRRRGPRGTRSRPHLGPWSRVEARPHERAVAGAKARGGGAWGAEEGALGAAVAVEVEGNAEPLFIGGVRQGGEGVAVAGDATGGWWRIAGKAA